jgi:ribosome-associated toxin RatA of RatAB toxin-antitoxin module
MIIQRGPRALRTAARGSDPAALGSVASHWSQLLRSAAVLLLMVVGTASGANPDRITVEARREGDAVIVEARASLHADLEIAWDVLTDYDRYAEFIPDLKSSRTLARSGSSVIVEQKGQAGFFLFHFPMEVTLSVSEEPRSGITSRAIAGTFREMTGSYTLLRDGEELRFAYSGRMVPDFILPPLIGTAAVKAAVQKQFGALVKQMQARAAEPAKPRGP